MAVSSRLYTTLVSWPRYMLKYLGKFSVDLHQGCDPPSLVLLLYYCEADQEGRI